MKRVLTAAVLAPLAVAVVLWAPFPLLLAVVALVALVSFWEYAELVGRHDLEKPGPAAYAAGLVILVAPEAAFTGVTLLALLALALAMGFRPVQRSLPAAGAMLLGVIYIFGCWKCALLLRAVSAHWLLFTLAAIWAGDIAAFYTGRAVGRHKLAPSISPAKTWEGAIASVVASMLLGAAYRDAFLPSVPLIHALVLSGAGNAAGQIGDLAESALKRGAGLKDSSNLLPGHGGLLDRTDSTLFSLPVVLGLLRLLSPS